MEKDYNILYFYNFGSPRVGNLAFCEIFDFMIDGFRVIHNNDIVEVCLLSCFIIAILNKVFVMMKTIVFIHIVMMNLVEQNVRMTTIFII